MLHFTENFDFSERPNTGEQGLEDTGNFLQCCAVTSARVRHRPDRRNVHMNNDIILLAGCEIIECQCITHHNYLALCMNMRRQPVQNLSAKSETWPP